MKTLGKYKSLGGMVRTIYAEEGLGAFWKGHMTAQYLSVIYMAIQFGMNESLTRKMFELFPYLNNSDSDTKILALARSACGAPAAICATLASYPFDVMRTRKIAQVASEGFSHDNFTTHFPPSKEYRFGFYGIPAPASTVGSGVIIVRYT